jgi:hypothetical protein
VSPFGDFSQNKKNHWFQRITCAKTLLVYYIVKYISTPNHLVSANIHNWQLIKSWQMACWNLKHNFFYLKKRNLKPIECTINTNNYYTLTNELIWYALDCL